jgi:hypothetical protein
MKRLISIFCLILISALGLVVPAGAQAATLTTVQLTSGKPVKVTISRPGQKIKYTFAATAHKHVTFQVTKFNLSDGTSPGSFYLDFYKPGGTSPYTSNYFGDNGYFDFTTPVSGTWSVKVVPYSSSVGSMILTFANDVATKALTSGTPVTTTIKFQGQHAGYTFKTTAGATRTFTVTNFNFTNGTDPGGFYLDFYKPGSASSYTSCYFGDNGFCDVTTPISGTWTVTLTPYSSSVGSMTLTMT